MSRLNSIIEYFGYEIPDLRFQSHILDHCSVPVLNTFFRNDFDGFNVLDVVNHEDDGDIPVTIFTAGSDHVVDPNVAIALQKKLPHSSAVFIWKGRHMRENNVREFYVRQATSLLANGCLNVPLIEGSAEVLATYTYTQSYVDFLQHMHATSMQSDVPSQSYALTSSLLTGPASSSSTQPCSSNGEVDLTVGHQEIEASISDVILTNTENIFARPSP